MYEDKLGRGWHNRVRSLVGVKKNLLSDSMIENDLYLKGTTLILFGELGADMMKDPEETPLNSELYQKAFRHVLASLICDSFESIGFKELGSKSEELLRKGLNFLKAIA